MKGYVSRLVILFAVCVVIGTSGVAKDKHLPLPPQVIRAKTVYIDNQSGVAKLGDRCYTELAK